MVNIPIVSDRILGMLNIRGVEVIILGEGIRPSQSKRIIHGQSVLPSPYLSLFLISSL